MNYSKYRSDKTESAKEYQDFVCKWLAKNYALVLTVFSSKKYQHGVGESLQGVEIKHDMEHVNTGNLYIEVGEKAKPRPGKYYPSGIYANDNSWLYMIGNYDVLYVFSKKQLIRVYEDGRFLRKIDHNKTQTSTGFLINTQQAESYCIKKFELK